VLIEEVVGFFDKVPDGDGILAGFGGSGVSVRRALGFEQKTHCIVDIKT
jgi:hypothetical protein